MLQGEKPKGGWHYFIDFAGPEATARWYATIGKNAWRMEEFQHDWGNATFDDLLTEDVESGQVDDAPELPSRQADREVQVRRPTDLRAEVGADVASVEPVDELADEMAVEEG